jgi:type I restriction enzyme S subunit
VIDLDPGQLAEVRGILARYVSEYEVVVFGSRANGNARKFSDLDLALIGNQALPLRRLAELKDALSESRLPIMADVLDWHALTAEFRRLVLSKFETIQVAPCLNPELRSTLQSARQRD